MDNNGQNPTQKGPKLPDGLPASTLSIVILWDQVTGAIQVTGVIDHQVIACGMLEAAKQVVLERAKEAAKNQLVVVPGPSLRMA